jgi:hypothetical protein
MDRVAALLVHPAGPMQFPYETLIRAVWLFDKRLAALVAAGISQL